MFKLEFATDNDAFAEDQTEVQRILEHIVHRLNNGHTYGNVLDVNGNTVGTWSLDA